MPNSITYDYKEFTLATGTGDYDVRTSIPELFDNITLAKRVVIKSDKTISFRFNNVNLPLIEMVVTATKIESPFQLPENFLDVNNIFVSNNSGALATISIFMV